MEERPDPNLPAKTLDHDADLQKKHQAMLDRLSTRHHARLDNSLARRSDSTNSSEATSSFLSRFSESKQSIDSQLADSRLIAQSDPSRLKTHFANISSSISDLEKLVAESSYFLPSYEVRSSLKTISDLKQNLEILNSELIPKRKFSFKNKATTKKELPKEPEPEPVKSDAVSVTNFKIPNSPGFRNKTNKTLIQKFKGTEVGEFTLSNLDSCEVRLIGCCNAVFMNRLKDCKVYLGPVIGSILIEEVEGCVFVLASHQIRIHLAKRSDFYLRLRSRPIIEDSNVVRFAPYCLDYEGIEMDLEKAGLSEETGNWGNVDDFKWLRAVQSPNWCVLPGNERVGKVRVEDFESGNEVADYRLFD
ncbi:C-CAP/cofactor C-like domain-containing protein, C, putative isoform 1 [Theobroma cacao]|uniref:C-CAP/cofactor C-like domain-containing protein, C, putative isoform 1 n=1 Tax=Theobroma cacao TaxID=3641 RepID=A0A061DJG9_THECC|nr:C-CAP/cofactor C-like domain-containing protein, C, putative isoform 1 [Theobroma cacao]